MSNILQSLTTAATIAMAALPTLALTTVAHAAPMSVKVSDLDMSSTQGQAVFSQRLDRAAVSFCRDQASATGTRINNTAACVAGVRAEATAKLAALGKVNMANR